MNTPDGNTVSTAQLAVSLMSNLARHIPAANMTIKEVGNRGYYNGCYNRGVIVGVPEDLMWGFS